MATPHIRIAKEPTLLEKGRTQIDANLDATYRTLLVDLEAHLDSPDITYDSVFKLCPGLSLNTLRYYANKLRIDGFTVAIMAWGGPTDPLCERHYLEVMVPQDTTGTSSAV